MKAHTTIKAIRNGYRKVFQTGYCELQYIFKYSDPQFYNAGVYGWNCNVYVNNDKDIAITTGYRNMAGRLIPLEIIEKYSNIAKEITSAPFSKPFNEVKAALDKNIEDFWNELNNL
jgi:hypothetical protein